MTCSQSIACHTLFKTSACKLWRKGQDFRHEVECWMRTWQWTNIPGWIWVEVVGVRPSLWTYQPYMADVRSHQSIPRARHLSTCSVSSLNPVAKIWQIIPANIRLITEEISVWILLIAGKLQVRVQTYVKVVTAKSAVLLLPYGNSRITLAVHTLIYKVALTEAYIWPYFACVGTDDESDRPVNLLHAAARRCNNVCKNC